MICPKCKTEKAIEEFHKDSTRATGVAYHCKACAKAAAKVHYKARKAREQAKKQKKHNIPHSAPICPVSDYDII